MAEIRRCFRAFSGFELFLLPSIDHARSAARNASRPLRAIFGYVTNGYWSSFFSVGARGSLHILHCIAGRQLDVLRGERFSYRPLLPDAHELDLETRAVAAMDGVVILDGRAIFKVADAIQ